MLFIRSTTASNSSNLHTYALTMGHKYVSKITDLPYHVLVVFGGYYCSGALIRSRIVATAASCVINAKEIVFVKFGGQSITDKGQVIPVLDVKIHEYFGYTSEIDNDIALLFLKADVHFSKSTKKILLIPQNARLRTGDVVEVSGWGSQILPQYTYLLLSTEMIVMSSVNCREVHRNKITQSNYCARYEVDRRLSDIGGPATYRKHLVGILSYHLLTDDGPCVAVFTNISYFNRWIMYNTKRLFHIHCQQKKEEQDTKMVFEEIVGEVQIGLVHRGFRATHSPSP